MKIKVTEEHIAKGVRENSFECPISCAIKDVVKDDIHVCVSAKIYVGPADKSMWGNYSKKFIVPTDVRNKITDYDAFGTMYPFEFDLNIPKEYLKEEVNVGG